jgi:hypothetical protein
MQAVIGAIERAADQSSDMGRSEEPVAGEQADNPDIVVGQTKVRRLRRTDEPRPPHCHTK